MASAMSPAANLRDAQSARVGDHEHRAVLGVGDGVEEAPDLLGAEDDRELLVPLGVGDVSDRPVLAECGAVEKAKRTDGDVERAPGHALFLDQVDLPGPDVLRAQFCGRAAEVAGEGGDASDVVVLRALGAVADPEVFEHPLA